MAGEGVAGEPGADEPGADEPGADEPGHFSGAGGPGAARSAGGAAAPRSALGALMAVQDIDTVISQLEHRRASLPERAALASAEAALEQIALQARAVDAERAELLERQHELEAEIASTASRTDSIERRLYAARGPARDLQAMDEEVTHLRARREELEDADLEVMVALEPLDAQLRDLEEQRRALLGRCEDLRRSIGEGESVIDDQLRERRSSREGAMSSVPADLQARYEALRARLGGTGAARLVGNRCGGCHLELPSMEVDRIRHLPAGTVVTCEQCGRILVSTED